MASIDIYATKSLTVSSDMITSNIKSNKIYIGYRYGISYVSYLYFDISSIPSNINNISGTLVLFRTIDNNSKGTYSMSPLLDYFSSSTNYINKPYYDSSLEKNFYVSKDSNIVEIDITKIMEGWIVGSLINKGIAIYGDGCNSRLFEFGSSLNKDISLVPFIKLYYDKDRCCPIPITELKCDYKIIPPIN